MELVAPGFAPVFIRSDTGERRHSTFRRSSSSQYEIGCSRAGQFLLHCRPMQENSIAARYLWRLARNEHGEASCLVPFLRARWGSPVALSEMQPAQDEGSLCSCCNSLGARTKPSTKEEASGCKFPSQHTNCSCRRSQAPLSAIDDDDGKPAPFYYITLIEAIEIEAARKRERENLLPILYLFLEQNQASTGGGASFLLCFPPLLLLPSDIH